MDESEIENQSERSNNFILTAGNDEVPIVGFP